MTSSSFNIDKRQSNILQMWGSQTNTRFNLRAVSGDPRSGDSDSYPPSEADRYVFRGLPENTSSMIELNSVVEKSDDIDETYDIESSAANAASRPSKTLRSILFNACSFFLVILTHSIMVGLGLMLLSFTQMGVVSTARILIHPRRQSLANIVQLIGEIAVDGNFARLAYLLMLPFTSAFALFFVVTLIGCGFQVFHPARDIGQNSRFYSAIAPKLSRHKNMEWPHITIQIPVYKEGLTGVIVPTIRSVQKAIKHYENLGGTASIYMNEDGMQVVKEEVAK